MVLMSQTLINFVIILSVVRLTSAYHCLQYMSVKSGMTVTQMWKISRLWLYGYRQPPWINDGIKSTLKQSSRQTKIYDNNGLRKNDHIKVLEISTECTKRIIKTKSTIFLK